MRLSRVRGVTVTIEKHEGERWLAHYVFEAPQKAMLFSHAPMAITAQAVGHLLMIMSALGT